MIVVIMNKAINHHHDKKIKPQKLKTFLISFRLYRRNELIKKANTLIAIAQDPFRIPRLKILNAE